MMVEGTAKVGSMYGASNTDDGIDVDDMDNGDLLEMRRLCTGCVG
jgi:hypothetical protein